MNNLLSYFGLVDVRMSASDIDLLTCKDKNSPSESYFNPMFEAVEAAAASKE